MAVDPYSSWSDDELASLPHGFRDDLYKGQVALVTGGAGGIGRAICMLLGRLGARIVTCGRDPHKLEQLRESLETQGNDVQTVQTNVRDPEQVASLYEKVWEK